MATALADPVLPLTVTVTTVAPEVPVTGLKTILPGLVALLEVILGFGINLELLVTTLTVNTVLGEVFVTGLLLTLVKTLSIAGTLERTIVWAASFSLSTTVVTLFETAGGGVDDVIELVGVVVVELVVVEVLELVTGDVITFVTAAAVVKTASLENALSSPDAS